MQNSPQPITSDTIRIWMPLLGSMVALTLSVASLWTNISTRVALLERDQQALQEVVKQNSVDIDELQLANQRSKP